MHLIRMASSADLKTVVNGHIESNYSKSTGQWTPLRLVSDPYMRLHGMAPVINYGQQAYEGLKAFRGPDGTLSLFRPERNAIRMQHSADVVSIPRVPEAMFLQACRAAVALNAEFVPPHETGAAMYVRPQIYGSSAQLGLDPPDEYTFCVYVCPTGVYHGTHPVKALILDDFDRTAPNGTGHAKVGGNYAPVLRWSGQAKAEGYGITLHLDSARHEEIDEFSTSGFIGVLGSGGADSNTTLVVPDSACVIDSVTSESAQQLARSFGWKVECRPIKYNELPLFDEVFAAGTAAALVPIRSITRRVPHELTASPRVTSHEDSQVITYMPDEHDDAGPVCGRILTALKSIQLGKVKDEFGWRHTVREEDRNIQEEEKTKEANGLTVGQMA